MQLENIISVCAIKDIDTWCVASPRIISYIDSKTYTLIVPDADLNDFRKRTPGEYLILSDSEFIDKQFHKLLVNKTRTSKTSIGWYIQQFIKLSALENVSVNGVALIWDADTVPLKNLSFEKNGIIKLYKGDEYHEPYFDVINNLFGIRKNNDFSYIAQCMPFRGRWAMEFFKHIENRNEKDWKESIIDCIDFSKPSGFSEYETLGTFVENNFPKEIEILPEKWQRYGNGLIGSIENLNYFESILKMKYDFISFEKWDKPYSLYSSYFKRMMT